MARTNETLHFHSRCSFLPGVQSRGKLPGTRARVCAGVCARGTPAHGCFPLKEGVWMCVTGRQGSVRLPAPGCKRDARTRGRLAARGE